jgi:N-acetylmuramic acid 6-phosphate (MurNAc-6-P) etherase
MADLNETIMAVLVETKKRGKKLKPNEVVKKVQDTIPDATKDQVKTAIKQLANEGKIIYSYAGGSFVEVPQ